MSKSQTTLLFSTLFIAVFISAFLGAVYSASYFYEQAEADWLKHYGLVNWSKGEYSQNYLYAMHAIALKEQAENKDYKGIMQKSCWLLLISLPKMNPEIWKGTPREKEDYENYQKAQETLTDLIESGYCAEIIEQQGTNKPNQSFNLDGAKSAPPS